MKKYLLLIIITLALLYPSCSDEVYTWKFKNKSTHPVRVEKSQNADDRDFTLDHIHDLSDDMHGGFRLVVIRSNIEIQFEYDAIDTTSDAVKAEIDESVRTITFLNK